MNLLIFRLRILLTRNKGKRTFNALFSNRNNGDFFTSCDVGWPHCDTLYGNTKKFVEQLKKHELIITSGFEIIALSGVTKITRNNDIGRYQS